MMIDRDWPRASFIIMGFNQEPFIEAAVQGAFAQDYANLQIVLSDDGSTDATLAIMERLAAEYRGPHEIAVLKTEKNLGVIRNLTRAIEASCGELCILAAGDDLSSPARTSELVNMWLEAGQPAVSLLYSDVRPIDKNGQFIEGWKEKVVRPPLTLARLAEGATGPLGACCAITPILIRAPQAIDAKVIHEDRVLPFRAALFGGPILFVDRPLVDYRAEGGVSRMAVRDRYHNLTVLTAKHMRRVLPDAFQRLSDAQAAGAPNRIVKRCRQVIFEQQALLEMSDGNALFRKALTAWMSGARLSVLVIQLLRFLRARVEKPRSRT